TVDALNNVLALVVMRTAAKPPDEDHPYGHGKFETLGALAIVVFLSITCFELVRDSLARLSGDRPLPLLSDLQLAILLGTLAVNVFVAWYEARRGEELDSELLLADAAHTRADVFVTIGVVVAMLFARRGWTWVDPVLALAIAAFIVRIAYRILQRAVPVLVDESAIPPGRIQALVERVDGVKGAYGIRSRGGHGTQVRYAEVTIAVDRDANVAAAHAIADEVEERLKRDLALTEVTVHVEPS
ncbi:MAG: cation diffusion facilitator family transporter, partial [Gammaproteobacteria bacterium]